MFRDPEVRERIYGPLRNVLLEEGHHARVLLGRNQPDALSVSTGSGVDTDAESGFFIFGRNRGWFILIPGPQPRFYCVINPANVADLVLMLCNSVKIGAVRAQANIEMLDPQLVEPCDYWQWTRDEHSVEQRAWEHTGWTEMPESDENRAWISFTKRIMAPTGRLRMEGRAFTWKIHDQAGNLAGYERQRKLTLAILDAMCQCSPKDERLLVLRPQHTCYHFDPHRADRRGFSDYWAVPIWPEADTAYFLSPRFEFGLLAEWKGRIHIFGDKLLSLTADPISDVLGPPKESGPLILGRSVAR